MKPLPFGGMVLWLWSALAWGQAEDSAQSLLDCAAANAPAQHFSLNADFDTVDELGQNVSLKARLYGQREESRLIINLMLQEPSNLAGTAFYLKEQPGQDDMRVYLPGLKRTRRISGSMAARDLWGTSFSYLDVKQMLGAFLGGEYQRLEDQEVDQRPVHVLEIRPDPAQEAPFARLQIQLDGEHCVPLQAEYRDAQNSLSKRLQADPASIIQLKDHHLATDMSMHDLDSGKVTRLRLTNVRFDERIPPGAFASGGFFRVP